MDKKTILTDHSENTRAGWQTIHRFSKKQMLPATFAGTVHIESKNSYQISCGKDGRFIIIPIGNPPTNKILTGHLNLKKAILTLDWDKTPKNCGIEASYQYTETF